MSIDDKLLCIWKEVAMSDIIKLEQLSKSYTDDIKITLSPEKDCYKCRGYDTKCKLYINDEMVGE